MIFTKYKRKHYKVNKSYFNLLYLNKDESATCDIYIPNILLITAPCVDNAPFCAQVNLCASDFQKAKLLCKNFCGLCDLGEIFHS